MVKSTKNIQSLQTERKIISTKYFSRMKHISLAIAKDFHKDTAQNRQSHSFEVANTIDIMNYLISNKVGFNVDRYDLGRNIGLLHDIGHMAFSHLGEITLNDKIKQLSNNELYFSSNSNNFVKLKKTKILEELPLEMKTYTLSSLVKHPEEMYVEHQDILDFIETDTTSELNYIKQFFDCEKLDSTLQCQIMDIADENSYIVSDIIDSVNLFDLEELKELFFKTLPFDIANNFSKVLHNKSNFIQEVDKLFFMFCDNFTLLENGIISPVSNDIEKVRKDLFNFTSNYVLKHPKIVKTRNNERKELEFFIDHYMDRVNNGNLYLPSKYYSKKLQHNRKNEILKLKVMRDFFGGITDKGLRKEIRKIKKGLI